MALLTPGSGTGHASHVSQWVRGWGGGGKGAYTHALGLMGEWRWPVAGAFSLFSFSIFPKYKFNSMQMTEELKYFNSMQTPKSMLA